MTAAPSPVRSAAPIGAALLLAQIPGLTLGGLLMGLATLGTAADPFRPVALMSATAVFAERLRGQVDLPGLEADVQRTVGGALRPSRTTLWIHGNANEAAR